MITQRAKRDPFWRPPAWLKCNRCGEVICTENENRIKKCWNCGSYDLEETEEPEDYDEASETAEEAD